MMESFLSRLLVIDDDENVRNTLLSILSPQRVDTSGLDAAAARLFGTVKASGNATPPAGGLCFSVDSAANGEQGLQRVRAALEAGERYAAIFVDMRMPGWDGLTTVERIREVDTQVEIIFVTAYSDYTIREIVARAGMNVSYYCKPFAPKEIQQLARKSVYDWNQARFIEELTREAAALPATHGSGDILLRSIFDRCHQLLATESLCLIELATAGAWRTLHRSGALSDDGATDRLIQSTPSRSDGVVWHCREHHVCFRFGPYALIADIGQGAIPPDPERFELVKLYLHQALRCIDTHALRIQLARSEQLSALGTGVAMVAHDLRSPISGVRTLVEQLMDSDASQPIDRASMDLIHAALRECEGTIEDLLDFVRGDSPAQDDHAPVSCCELVADTLAEAASWPACKGIQLTACDCVPFTCIGSLRKLRRALVNLVLNAAEALRDHPSLRTPKITISCGHNPDGGWLCVADNGPGLPNTAHDRLFEPFVSLTKSGGTGLGLAVVQRFIADHGARVLVDSNASGCRFTIQGLQCQPSELS